MKLLDLSQNGVYFAVLTVEQLKYNLILAVKINWLFSHKS